MAGCPSLANTHKYMVLLPLSHRAIINLCQGKHPRSLRHFPILGNVYAVARSCRPANMSFRTFCQFFDSTSVLISAIPVNLPFQVDANESFCFFWL